MNKTFNISIVTETYPPEVNGVAVTLNRFVTGLNDRAYPVQLIRPAQSETERPGNISTDDGVELCLSASYSIPMYPDLSFGWAQANALQKHFQRFETRSVYIATEGPLGHSALQAARKMGLPVISGFHTHFESYARDYHLKWLQPLVSRYLKYFHNRCDTTLVSSGTLTGQTREIGINNIQNINRGVDTAQFSPAFRDPELRAKWGIKERQRVVLFVSRLAPEKNLELLFRTFKKMHRSAPWLKLVVVGDGPSRKKYQKAYPKVVFCGTQTGHDLSRHYASADLFLFPSLSETYGLVVAEAMASGLPVIGFDYAAPASLIEAKENGWLASYGDEQAFTRIAVKAAHVSESRLMLMRERARETTQSLSWSNSLDDLEKILRDNLKEPPYALTLATT